MGPKIHERGLRWAPQSLLFVDRYFAFPNRGDYDNRGFLATHGNATGLVVELAGSRISIARPAKGLPEHLAGFGSKPRNDDNEHPLLVKDNHGRWYMLKHRLFDTSDCPPRLKEMSTVISTLSSPWIIYRGSSSPVPENKFYLGLLVEEVKEQQSQSNNITCVEIKSQIDFSRLPTGLNQICQAAYCLAQELASSTAARRLEDVLENAPRDLDDSVY